MYWCAGAVVSDVIPQASKADVVKLSKIVKQLLFVVTGSGQLKGIGEHAVIATKPLQSWKCLSCEQPLQRLSDGAGQHLPAGQLPPSAHSIRAHRIYGGGGEWWLPGRVCVSLLPSLCTVGCRTRPAIMSEERCVMRLGVGGELRSNGCSVRPQHLSDAWYLFCMYVSLIVSFATTYSRRCTDTPWHARLPSGHCKQSRGPQTRFSLRHDPSARMGR